MILHSVVPSSVMQQMIADSQLSETVPCVQTIVLSPLCTLEGTLCDGGFRVSRLISTNPQDYLSPDLMPGSIRPVPTHPKTI